MAISSLLSLIPRGYHFLAFSSIWSPVAFPCRRDLTLANLKLAFFQPLVWEWPVLALCRFNRRKDSPGLPHLPEQDL